MRVLVTGSRGWLDVDRLNDALDLLHVAGRFSVQTIPTTFSGFRTPGITTLVSGRCTEGGDLMCEQWAERNGVPVEPHPADWAHDRGAGFTRNREMVQAGAAVCMAFGFVCVKKRCKRPQPHCTHGTLHCATTAMEAQIPVAMHRDGW